MAKRIALVTGGLRGIGRAISEYLAGNDFTVYAASREGIRETDSKDIVPVRMDVTVEESMGDVFGHIGRNHGALDLLVNNAGIGLFQAFETVQAAEWMKVFQTNTFGVFHCTKFAYPLLAKRGGRIVNLSSISTQRHLPGNAVYAASKHAVNGFGQTLAEEWYPRRIFVTNVLLGATYTDIWKDADGFSPEDMLHVNDVARVVGFVAETPLHIRIDEITVTPAKGVL